LERGTTADNVGVKKNKTNAISRFMGEIASSLNKDETTHDGHRTQKISLLKRIIEHYNIKSVERKYYSSNSALIQI